MFVQRKFQLKFESQRKFYRSDIFFFFIGRVHVFRKLKMVYAGDLTIIATAFIAIIIGGSFQGGW